MKRKYFYSTYSKFVLGYFLVFAISVGILGLLTAYITTKHFEAQLEKKIEHEANQLLVDYKQDGLDELWHDVKERVVLDQPGRLWYSIISNNGSRDFDNFKISNLNAGWHEVPYPNETKILITDLNDGVKLAIASNYNDINSLQRALTNNFLSMLIIIVIIGLMGGLFLSNRYLSRINQIRMASLKIGQGDLKSRVPIHGHDNIFDDVAQIINSMMDQIETLVFEVQRVSSNIAHELRTPLGHLRQRVEDLSHDPSLGAEALKNTNEALEEVDRTLSLFSSILRLSEIKAGARKSKFIKFNFSQLVQEVIEIYEPIAIDSNRTLHLNLEDKILTLGDPSFLRQLVANLIENALQHTPSGTQISVSLVDSKDQKAKLIIHDNGPGISNLDEARKPFSKLSKSSTQGAGLGLALVEEIVILHGYKIQYLNDNGLKIIIELNTKNEK